MNSPNSPMRRFRLLVENRHGALIKIVGTFSTRAYNINTLYVRSDQDEELSQLTVTLRCDDRQCELLRKQLMKIVDMVDVQVEEDESARDNGEYQTHALTRRFAAPSPGGRLPGRENVQR